MIILSITLSMSLAAQAGLSVAVAPFGNLSGDRSRDYLGFQVAEFVSGALAGYPKVTVVERAAIDRIIQEQELQLSGLIDAKGAVSVGALANAAQMVVGSFTLDSKGNLSLSGRLVDVATGEVLGSALASGPTAPSPNALYRDFAFKLLSSVKGYGVTVAVEARLDTLTQEDASVNADYARALEASFRKDDEDARKYLEKVLQGDRLAVSSYVDAAGRYRSVVSRLEGESIYTQLVKRMVSRNSALMMQVEPLTIYRNTLKTIARRIDAALAPETVALAVIQKERIQIGEVSATVSLPVVSLGLSQEAIAVIGTLVAQQDIVGIRAKDAARKVSAGLVVTRKAPTGTLLSPAALDGLFDLSFSAAAGYAIVFHDKAGSELWRLVAAPREILRLDAANAQFLATGTPSLRVPVPRDGFALRPDGSVEIQARALQRLAGLRVELDKGAFKKTTLYASSGDIRWKSLILHAYRKNYVKIAAEDDSCPAIKDLVVADSFYETRDPELGRVPIVPEDDRRAGYAALTAVVYFGDETSTTVQVSWSGNNDSPVPVAGIQGFSRASRLVAASLPDGYGSLATEVSYSPGKAARGREAGSKEQYQHLAQSAAVDPRSSNLQRLSDSSTPFGGGLKPTSVLYFPWPWGGVSGSGSLEVRARVGIDHVKTARVERVMGTSWYCRWSWAEFLLSDEWLFGSDGSRIQALDTTTGKPSWSNEIRGAYAFALGDGRLYITGRDAGTRAIDAATGKQVWGVSAGGVALLLNGGKLYIGGEYSFALDAGTGAQLWQSRYSGSFLLLDGARLYVGGNSALNPATGELVWNSGNQGASLVLDGGRLYVGGMEAKNPATGKTIWVANLQGGQGISSLLDSGRLYVDGRYALDATTGKQLWQSTITEDVRWAGLILVGNRLFVGAGYALDPMTGKVLWQTTIPISRKIFYGKDRLYASNGWALDLSVINRE